MSSIFSKSHHVTSIRLRFNRRTFYFHTDNPHRETAIIAGAAVIAGRQKKAIVAEEATIIAERQETAIIAGRQETARGVSSGGLRGLEHPPKVWHNSQLSSCVTTIVTDKQQLIAKTNNKLTGLALNGSISLLLGLKQPSKLSSSTR